VPVLLALSLIDAQQHALAVDIAHLQARDLGHTQARAVRQPECRLVLRPRRRFEQPQDLVRREHVGQPARLAHKREVAHHLGPAERCLEEEPQRRDRAVHGRRRDPGLALMHLEPAQILCLRRVWRAAEEHCEVLNVPDVVALRLLADLADGHVLDHASCRRHASSMTAAG